MRMRMRRTTKMRMRTTKMRMRMGMRKMRTRRQKPRALLPAGMVSMLIPFVMGTRRQSNVRILGKRLIRLKWAK